MPRITLKQLAAQSDPVLIELARKKRERDLVDRIRQLEKKLSLAVETAAAARSVKVTRPRPGRAPHRHRGDRIRVAAGDLHGMKMNHAAVAAFLADVKALDPDEIILGGDIVDCGGFLAQHHVLGYVAETEYSYEEDIAAGNEFLTALQEAAPRAIIHYLEGNHENRVERWILTTTLRHRQDSGMLRRLMAPHILLKLKERGIPFYPRNEIHGDCRQPGFLRMGKCYFVHEINSSKNAASAAVDRVAGNVVFFHTHREDSRTVRKPNVGTIGAWNPGCLCELMPMWQHTKPNDWTNGYAVQMITTRDHFLHVNVPIVEGRSLLIPLTTSGNRS